MEGRNSWTQTRGVIASQNADGDVVTAAMSCSARSDGDDAYL